MLVFVKRTHEEAIRMWISQHPTAAGTILASRPGDTLQIHVTSTHDVPAAYAKAILADVVAEAAKESPT